MTEIALFLFVIGSVVGSFLNVCIYRMPRDKSVVQPASFCPHCRKPIRWYDNIPFVSYLLLRGRCRFCHKKISARYILVEALTASLFMFLYGRLGLGPLYGIYAVFFSSLLAASFIDLEHQVIPDEISLGGLGLGIALSFLFPSLHGTSSPVASLVSSLLGALVGGGSIYLIGLLGNFLFKKESMGGGDVKLLAMVGSLLGWEKALLAFFIAPLFGSVVGITLKLTRGAEVIPYGPFLSLASFIAFLWEREILWYLGIVR